MDSLKQLEHDGYCVIDGVPDPVLEQLSAHVGTRDGNPEAFRTTARDGDPAERIRLDRELKRILEPLVHDLISPDMSAFMGAFLVKPPREEAWLPVHQDLTYTDEKTYRSYAAWVPLNDVGDENGGISLIPGSHLWLNHTRAGGPTGSPDLTRLQERLVEACHSVPVPRGSMLAWDSATFHGSTPNRSTAPRPVAALSFAPRQAELRYFHRTQDGVLNGYRIDGNFLDQERPFGLPPQGYPSAGAWEQIMETEDVESALDEYLRSTPSRGL